MIQRLNKHKRKKYFSPWAFISTGRWGVSYIR